MIKALLFASVDGAIITNDEATELVIVVVSEGKAKVVFDNYAFAYKYTPAPNFSIEFVNDWSGIDEDSCALHILAE